MLVVNNKIIYTDGDYINPQINDVLTFEPVSKITRENVDEIYYMTESAMEDVINCERKIQLGGISEAGSGDTGGEKEISSAMQALCKQSTVQIAGGRIEIRREHIGGMWNNRYVPQTGRPGTTVRSALQVHDTGSGTGTRTDSSGSEKNSSSNEGESKRKVGTKPQLLMDKLKQYS